MSENLIIYQVRRNRDLTEGRGPMEVLASFLNEDDAWKMADTLCGVMGRKPSGSWRTEKYGDVDVVPQVVYRTFEDWDPENTKNKVAAALAKLTPAERVLLGLQR